MCTAITYETADFYFGRNLDLEYSYEETITITPRNFCFSFRHVPAMPHHYAMIGMAYVREDYPLYYEATNEKGLSMAGLNFPGYAKYGFPVQGKQNVATFELIPWVLGQCASLKEARRLLEQLNLTKDSFRPDMPPATLHWMISSREGSLTVECIKGSLNVCENPVGVLTNSPPFAYQMTNLSNYMGLSSQPPENRFSRKIDLTPYSRGMGGWGLPGDLSSASRFVKAAFIRLNSRSGTSESESVSQFFHILGSVAQQRGAVDMGEGKYEVTIYSSCCNATKGIYYYTTYENSQITGVDMHREDLDGRRLVSYPMLWGQNIHMQN